MFGHQDDKKDDDTSSNEETVITPDQQADEAADTTAIDQAQAEDTQTQDADPDGGDNDSPTSAPTTDEPASDDDAWQHPGAPIDDDSSEEKPQEEEDEDKTPAPINDIIGANAGPSFRPLSQTDEVNHTDHTPHDLIDVKQKALNELAPLVSQLDQSPEDKFRTMMMMIQASDDQSLVKTAYEAAHEIKDEKVRAQALLDVVNEINYFTQHADN